MIPVRIQRKRVRGYDMQKESLAINGLPCVSVTRPGRFGNPYTSEYGTPMQCVLAYEDHVRKSPKLLVLIERHLRGKNLACFCKSGAVCHGDVLLKIANQP